MAVGQPGRGRAGGGGGGGRKQQGCLGADQGKACLAELWATSAQSLGGMHSNGSDHIRDHAIYKLRAIPCVTVIM